MAVMGNTEAAWGAMGSDPVMFVMAGRLPGIRMIWAEAENAVAMAAA